MGFLAARAEMGWYGLSLIAVCYCVWLMSLEQVQGELGLRERVGFGVILRGGKRKDALIGM